MSSLSVNTVGYKILVHEELDRSRPSRGQSVALVGPHSLSTGGVMARPS